MVTAIACQKHVTIPALKEGKPTLSRLPAVLHQYVIDFLSMQNIAQSLRLVRKDWQHETRNDYLDLSSTKIDFHPFLKIIADHFKNLHSFHSVHLGYCSQLNGDFACETLQFLPALTKLRLPSNTSDEGLKHFKNYKGALNYLSLSCCSEVTDAGLRELAGSDFPLTHLNVQGCNITGNGIKSIAKFSLTYLDLSDCRRIFDSALMLLSKCPLTTLKLSGCELITQKGMSYLSHLKLERLWLSRCHWIEENRFGFLNKMPLKWLRLDHTRITHDEFYALELPSLTDLDIAECRNFNLLNGLCLFPLKTLCISGFRYFNENAANVLSQLKITSLSMPSTNVENNELDILAALPLRYLNIRANFHLEEGFGDILLGFSLLTTLELTPTVYTGKRQTIAAAVGFYLEKELPFGEEIPDSRVSKSVEDIHDTILEYLEPKVAY